MQNKIDLLYPEVSIIIPVYNTPKSDLYACLESILNQQYKDFEIIIVDDGSEKTCAEDIDNIVAKYKNVRVAHKKNEGVSVARNYGVSIAKGNYIMFVDADDKVAPWMLKNAIKVALETNADWVIGGVKRVTKEELQNINDEECNLTYRECNDNDRQLLNQHFFDLSVSEFLAFDNGSNVTRGPYARLLKKEIVEKNSFIQGIKLGEDTIWNQQILSTNIKTVIVFQSWYYYLINDYSATSKYRPNIIKELNDIILLLKQQYVNVQNKKCYYNRMLEELEKVLDLYLYHPECTLNNYEKKIILKTMFKEEPWKELNSKEFRRMFSAKTKFRIYLYRTGRMIEYQIIKKMYYKNRKKEC